MDIYNLEPHGQSQKSFYGKAKVISDGNTAKLQSYNTIVAEYDYGTKKMKVNGWYSNTTGRHINAFLYKHGFDRATKKELENWDNS